MRSISFVCLVIGCLVLAGCRREKGPPPEQPPPDVAVIRPVTTTVPNYYEYNGHLETTQMIEVRARVKGFITAVHFKEGMEVRGMRGAGVFTVPGDLLYSIDEREYRTAVKKGEAELEKAKADIANWTAQIDLAQAELRRAEEARAKVAGAENEVDKAKATLGVNKAMLASAIANSDAAAATLHTAHIQLGYTRIHARIDGRISRTLVDEGNLVGQTEPTLLTTVVRMDELFVYFDVPEKDWMAWGNELSHDLKKEIPIWVGATGENGFPHEGHIDFRENRVDPGTGTVRIRGRIKNRVDPKTGTRPLYPGLYARIRLPDGSPKKMQVIPEEALMTGQDGRYLFVVGAENKVERRVVPIGPQVYRIPPAVENPKSEWTLFDPKPSAPKGSLPPRKNPSDVKSVVAIWKKGLKEDQFYIKEGESIIVDGLQRARPGIKVAPETWEFGPAKKEK